MLALGSTTTMMPERGRIVGTPTDKLLSGGNRLIMNGGTSGMINLTTPTIHVDNFLKYLLNWTAFRIQPIPTLMALI